MIEIDFQTDPNIFLSNCGEYLAQHEAEHNLIFSLCRTAELKRQAGTPSGTRFYTLSTDGEFTVAAVRQPPHNLVLSRARSLDIGPLAEKLAVEEADVPGIVGPADVAASFTDIWLKLTGRKSAEYMDQIVYNLKTVHELPSPPGFFRLADAKDLKILAPWVAAFAKETLPKTEQLNAEEALARTTEFIAQERIAVWDANGAPAAMAAVSGTEHVARINLVYTPAELRGQGYASAVVGALSQRQLDSGKTSCCLYADARNHVSNSIYRKIGYEFAGRSSHYVLEKKA